MKLVNKDGWYVGKLVSVLFNNFSLPPFGKVISSNQAVYVPFSKIGFNTECALKGGRGPNGITR